jgi:prolyl 4-hydroxylase
MTIIYIIPIVLLILVVIFLVIKKKKSNNLIDKYSKDISIDEIILQNLDKNYKPCDDVTCQHCDKLADINDEYILPTLHPNIISADETEYILKKSESNYKNSVTVGGHNSNIRKSQTAWLDKFDPVVKNIISRVCDLTNTPFINAENLQVVKYEKDGFYNEHFDSVANNSRGAQHFLSQGGHRIITMLIYLNDDFDEGGTRFVVLNKDIKPPKYHGILFHTLDKNKQKCHPKSLHAGLPIKSGHKIIANVWIRENEYPYDLIKSNNKFFE